MRLSIWPWQDTADSAIFETLDKAHLLVRNFHSSFVSNINIPSCKGWLANDTTALLQTRRHREQGRWEDAAGARISSSRLSSVRRNIDGLSLRSFGPTCQNTGCHDCSMIFVLSCNRRLPVLLCQQCKATQQLTPKGRQPLTGDTNTEYLLLIDFWSTLKFMYFVVSICLRTYQVQRYSDSLRLSVKVLPRQTSEKGMR